MEALKRTDKGKILFLDIETVPQYPSFEYVPETFKKHWENKVKNLKETKELGETPAEAYKRAGIYSEFGKIISITVGMFHGDSLRLKTFYGDEEIRLLKEFTELLQKHYDTDKHYLCAHNGKEFDFPFIARRTLIHGLKLPCILDSSGKKPWDVRHLDTMELWKFGDYKSFTSLNLLAEIFGIPSPKGDMDGSMMYKVYWEDRNWERIVKYNQRDVFTVVQIFLRFRGEKLMEENNIVIVQ